MRRLRETFVRRVARISTEDAGFVALLVALCLPVFIALLAFAVDVSNWYLVQQQEQKAADDASLAGVIYLPGDICTAYQTAFAVAGQNGFPSDYDATKCTTSTVGPGSGSGPNGKYTVTVQLGAKAGELQVTINKTVRNAFASIPLLGQPTTKIGKSATAAFAGPAAMGSPCNVLGNEKMEAGAKGYEQAYSTCPNDGYYWLEDSGPKTSKIQGDAIQTTWCTGSTKIDGCTSTSTGEPGGTNTEYSSSGYLYGITVPRAGTFNLEVYDGVYADLGDTCTTSNVWSGSTTAANPYVKDASARYAAGNTEFCTGDHSFTGNDGDGNAITQTFVVHAPPDSPADPLSGTVLCTITLPGIDSTTLASDGSGNLGGLAALLTKTNAKYNQGFAQYFRQWAPLSASNNPSGAPNTASLDFPSGCASKALTQPGQYVMQAFTNGLPTGGGQNRFSLRGYYSSSPDQSGIAISGLNRVALYVHDSSAQPMFHMVRLDSGAAGHVLTLQFFDFGDATGGGNEGVQVFAPDDSSMATNSTTAFSNCTGAGYPGTNPSPVTVTSSCKVSIPTNPNPLNGLWQYIKIPIPTTYICKDDTNTSDCWVQVQITPPSGGSVTDTTTWGASLSGDPVRLVQ